LAFFPIGSWSRCGVASIRFSAASRRCMVSCSLYWSARCFLLMEDITADPDEFPAFNFGMSVKGYWKNRKTPNAKGDAGETAQARLCEEVGRALSCWENVEEACIHLLMTLARSSGGQTHDIIFRAFGSVQSGVYRRTAIEYAGQANFGNNWKTAGPYLMRAVDHVAVASKRRDEIAHGRVLSPPQAEGTHLLLPPRYNTKLTKHSTTDIWGYEGA